MNQENLKRLLKEILAYRRSMDGIFHTPLETTEFSSMVECEYKQLKLVRLSGSYNCKITNFLYMFQVTQEEIDQLVKAMGEAPSTPQYCLHDWKLYEGIVHKDWYCVRCNQTREWTWTEK